MHMQIIKNNFYFKRNILFQMNLYFTLNKIFFFYIKKYKIKLIKKYFYNINLYIIYFKIKKYILY